MHSISSQIPTAVGNHSLRPSILTPSNLELESEGSRTEEFSAGTWSVGLVYYDALNSLDQKCTLRHLQLSLCQAIRSWPLVSVPPEASILVHLTKYLIFSLPGEPFVIVKFLLTIHYCSLQYEACLAYSSYGAIQQLQIPSIWS